MLHQEMVRWMAPGAPNEVGDGGGRLLFNDMY